MALRIELRPHEIQAFCRRWRIQELSFFGSVLREDFRPDSDVDVLITPEPDARWSLFELASMRDELMALTGRPVDLLTRSAVETSRNPIRRRAILDGLAPYYVA